MGDLLQCVLNIFKNYTLSRKWNNQDVSLPRSPQNSLFSFYTIDYCVLSLNTTIQTSILMQKCIILAYILDITTSRFVLRELQYSIMMCKYRQPRMHPYYIMRLQGGHSKVMQVSEVITNLIILKISARFQILLQLISPLVLNEYQFHFSPTILRFLLNMT